MTFFSVIIPTYNRAHIITETIESVLHQTYPDFEILLVDDGSTDNTEQMIKNQYANNEKIKYFLKQNEERGAARNYGLKQAKGEFAVFFDSDDFMKPNYIETLNKIIIKSPEVRMLAAKYNYDNNGKIEEHPLLKDLTEGWYDQDLFLKGNILACNYCLKIKDHHFQLFPPERELASMEDWLFLLINLTGNRIYIVNEVCVSMRQHDGRSMNDNQKVIGARIKATNWVLNRVELSPVQRRKVVAWSHYFCGIHQYLDHKRNAAVREAVSAIKTAGLQKDFLLLLAKSILGRKLIDAIRWKYSSFGTFEQIDKR